MKVVETPNYSGHLLIQSFFANKEVIIFYTNDEERGGVVGYIVGETKEGILVEDTDGEKFFFSHGNGLQINTNFVPEEDES
jgi:RNase P/RNase MRP subunit p29